MTKTMIDILATIKGATVIAGIAFGSMMIGDAAVIDEQTPISLGAGVAVGATVVIGAWYLSSRLQKIDDKLKSINNRLDSLPCDRDIEKCPKNGKNK